MELFFVCCTEFFIYFFVLLRMNSKPIQLCRASTDLEEFWIYSLQTWVLPSFPKFLCKILVWKKFASIFFFLFADDVDESFYSSSSANQQKHLCLTRIMNCKLYFFHINTHKIAGLICLYLLLITAGVLCKSHCKLIVSNFLIPHSLGFHR